MPRKKKQAPRWPVEWFRTRIGPSEWRVVLSVPNASPPLDGAEGATEFLTSTIYLRATLPTDRLPDVYVHELAHAAGYVSAMQRALALTDAQEEIVVSMLAPLLTQALVDAGHLKMPPMPELPAAQL